MTTESYSGDRPRGKLNLPPALAPLTALNNWLGWRSERAKKGKLTKVPYQVRFPERKASASNPETWASYPEAIAAASAFSGMGFCLTGTEVAAFDLDDCRDPVTGAVHPWASALVERAGSYTEITPSGKGLRIIGFGTGEEVHRKLPVGGGVSCELYRRATRYITMTGRQMGDYPLVNIDAVIDAVLSELERAIGGTQRHEQRDSSEIADDEEVSDDALEELIKDGCGEHYGGDRSRAVWRVIHGLLRRGRSPKAILKIVVDRDNKISDHIFEKPNPEEYARKQIDKAIAELPRRIIYYADRPALATDETQKAIVAEGRPVYSRAHMLVERLWAEYPASKGRKTKLTRLQPYNIHTLAYAITKHVATYAKYDAKGELVAIAPPVEVLQELLKIGHWGFSHITGVVNAPTLRPDGTILDKRGYDPATQLWANWDDSLILPTIPEGPSKDDAEKALKLYTDLLEGFPFVSELDKSVAVAAILTAVLRGAFDLAPMFLFLASVAGTGKSYLIDLVSVIVNGRWCPVITGSKNEEELEKRLGALLLEGISLISLDNLSFDLKGDLLNQMCTQRSVKIRILGKSEMPECEWRGTIFANGNNIRLVGDLTRRSLISNLDAVDERPELRKFEFDPIEDALKYRGAYVAAALIIARAYRARGRREECSPIASYGEWSVNVREPLIWLGMEDPVKSMDQARADDPQRSAARELIAVWREHLGTTRLFKVGHIVEAASNHSDLSNLLMERCGERNIISVARLGYWLRSLKNQIHDGYRIIAEQNDHGNRWKLEPVKKDEPRVPGREGDAF